MRMPSTRYASLVLGTSLVLAACGGGGGGGGSGGSATTSISGSAATGAALTSGTVELSCKDGLQQSGIAISATGTWGTTVPTANLPCAIKASDGTNTYYSFTVGNGATIVANVTPLTTLALAQILGATPDSLFASLSATDLARLNTTAIEAAISALNAALAQYALPAGFNPVTTPLVAAAPGQAGNDYDGLLDQFNDANTDLAALITGAANGTLPTLATPSYTPAATGLSDFFTRFAGSYTLTVNNSGAEGANNPAAELLFPQDGAIGVQFKGNGDVIVNAVGRSISYLASTYAGNTTGDVSFARTEFMANEGGKNVLRYRSANGSFLELYVTYDPASGMLQVSPQGFVNNEGYASLSGRIVAPPAALAETCTDLTYSGSNNDRYSNNQSVCFTRVSSSTLAVGGKTLSNPTQNTAVSAPYSAWVFVDGNYSYEVIFNGSALHEINLSVTGGAFLGQFAAPTPDVTTPVISGFSPASGAIDSTVTITGTGFSSTLAENVVRFSSNVAGPAPQATVVSGSSTELVVTVPAGAMTGQITVYNGNAVVSSSDSFTVTTGPTTPATLASLIGAAHAGSYLLSCPAAGGGTLNKTVVINADGSSTVDGDPVVNGSHAGAIGASFNNVTSSGSWTTPSPTFNLFFNANGTLMAGPVHGALHGGTGAFSGCSAVSGARTAALNPVSIIGDHALSTTLTCTQGYTPNAAVTNNPVGSTAFSIGSNGTITLGGVQLSSADYNGATPKWTFTDNATFPIQFVESRVLEVSNDSNSSTTTLKLIVTLNADDSLKKVEYRNMGNLGTCVPAS